MVYSKDFQPAAVGSGETTALFAVDRGERVISASILSLIAAAGGSTSTFDVGDTADADGYIAAFDCETAAQTMTAGAGALLANSGGKLYTTDGTVDIVYTPGGGPGATNPKCRVRIAKIREW